jgi:hypothetical protein
MFSSYLEVAARLGWRFAWETRYVSKYCAALRFAPHVSLYLHSACGPHSRPRAFMHAEQPSTLLAR